MRKFTNADAVEHGAVKNAMLINTDSLADLVHCPLPWQSRGLSQTATGYGAKLTTGHKISFCGRLYRLYNTCYSNCGSVWFIAKGIKYFVH